MKNVQQNKKKVDDVRNIYIFIYFVTEPTSCLSPGHCFHQQEGTENGIFFDDLGLMPSFLERTRGEG